MTARIYQPAKTAMQSGCANTRDWLLEFEPETRKSAEPLHKKWADAVRGAGGDADAIMNELKASLAQYNAAY